MDKRAVSTFLSVKLLNPLVKAVAGAGLPLPGVVILETTGRKSGQARRTPVGKAVQGDTLWIVAEHGYHASYVRNLQANPRVRARIGRHWREGSAHLLPAEDARERQRTMPKANARMVRLMGSQLLTVRVDLEPRRERGSTPF